MKKDLSISINKPCNQNFKNFKKTNKGGFCNSCTKEVIDFRKFTDKEIVSFFNNTKEKNCGLFLTNQIKNYSDNYPQNDIVIKRNLYNYLFSFSILSLFPFNNSYSQTIKNDSIQYEVKNEIDTKSKQDNNNKKTTGQVLDDLGPLPGANVTIKGTNFSTSTDFSGNFYFNKELIVGDTIIVSFLGLKTKEYKISDINQIKIVMETYGQSFVTMGEVEVNKIYKSKITFFQKIKNLFK